MLTYRYQAVDSGGRVVSGEVQASDARSAQQQLATQGLRVVQLVASASSPTTSSSVASASSPTTSSSVASSSSPTKPSLPTTPATRRFWEHSRVSPHQMVVWLTQLRSMLRAGVSPASAFQNLGQRSPHKGLQHASAQIAHDTAHGVAISDAMSKYPELFPCFLVGAFRAAEHGGYLPEMIERIMDYYEQNRVVHRWTKYTRGCLWLVVLLAPLIAPFGIGFVWAFAEFQGGGSADALRVLGANVGRAFLRFGLPTMLILIALMLLIYLIGGSERLGARVRANGLGFSLYADWIRAQSLEQYLFHLSRLTQAGVYPATAHTLAAGAIPNLALAEALLTIDLERNEGAAHIDAALERSGLFPLEEIMMARTGLQTGEVPSVLQTLANWYKQRAAERTQQLPRTFFTFMSLISAIATGIVILVLVWGYYSSVFDAVDRFMGVE